MKEKNVAGILALFLGGFGVHRFYLGQTGLGIFYLIFCWFPVMWIVGLIDAIAFFSMDNDKFDRKYNREYFFRKGRQQETQYQERRSRPDYDRRYKSRRPSAPPSRSQRTTRKRNNPYKAAGVAKFKDYDYDGAIEDFKKALEIEPDDIATHFNIACAYSINENTERAFYHLDQAVSNGFTDFKRIREHDKLAYLRIQNEYDDFAENGFRLEQQADIPQETTAALSEAAQEPVEDHSHILEQLKKLGDLREKGLLTEEEFSYQKKKLLG